MEEMMNFISKVTGINFYQHTWGLGGLQSPMPSLTHLIFLNRDAKWHLIMGLVCSSLIVKDKEHLYLMTVIKYPCLFLYLTAIREIVSVKEKQIFWEFLPEVLSESLMKLVLNSAFWVLRKRFIRTKQRAWLRVLGDHSVSFQTTE